MKSLSIKELGSISESEHMTYGRYLADLEKRLQWEVGDWYNTIQWGDKQAACAEAGLSFDFARRCGQVAAQFQFGEKRQIVSFTHCLEIASNKLSELDRLRLWTMAKDEKLTVMQLRQRRKEITGNVPTPPKEHIAQVDNLIDTVKGKLPAGTNKSTVNAVVNGLRGLEAGLKKEFNEAVMKQVEIKTAARRERLTLAEDRAKAAYEQTINIKAGVKAFMTREEFMLVRRCLHPDTNPNDKAAQAFAIFNRLADVKNWK